MRFVRTTNDWPHVHDRAQITLLGQWAQVLREVGRQCRARTQDARHVDAILIATHQAIAPMRGLLRSLAIIKVADRYRVVAVAMVMEADAVGLEGSRQRTLRQRCILDDVPVLMICRSSRSG
mgnify:CR=1 FL=1